MTDELDEVLALIESVELTNPDEDFASLTPERLREEPVDGLLITAGEIAIEFKDGGLMAVVYEAKPDCEFSLGWECNDGLIGPAEESLSEDAIENLNETWPFRDAIGELVRMGRLPIKDSLAQLHDNADRIQADEEARLEEP